MRAISKYLNNYSEECAKAAASFVENSIDYAYQNCLIIPAFKEPESFAYNLKHLPNTSSSLHAIDFYKINTCYAQDCFASLLATRAMGFLSWFNFFINNKLLIILNINAPNNAKDMDLKTNYNLIQKINKIAPLINKSDNLSLHSLSLNHDLLLIDQSSNKNHRLDPKQGVGLARKIGSDCALWLHHKKIILSCWLYQTDADSILPEDYFYRLKLQIKNLQNKIKNIAAIVFPFKHKIFDQQYEKKNKNLVASRLINLNTGSPHPNLPPKGKVFFICCFFAKCIDYSCLIYSKVIMGLVLSLLLEIRLNHAIQHYDHYLNNHVDNLKRIGSPYAFHTIGSTIAINADFYAKARGFPKLAAGEDFYILNKLAKIGDIKALSGAPIILSGRISNRTPFGTGQALNTLLADKLISKKYNPYPKESYDLLKILLDTFNNYDLNLKYHLKNKLNPDQFKLVWDILINLGVKKWLKNCPKNLTQSQITMQYHNWFDGLKAIKFLKQTLAPI